jgi:hypothetical protein
MSTATVTFPVHWKRRDTDVWTEPAGSATATCDVTTHVCLEASFYTYPPCIRSNLLLFLSILQAMKRQELHTKFLSENLKGRDNSENLGKDGEILLELILGK